MYVVHMDPFFIDFCMWYFSNVFRRFPFLSIFMISIVSVMLPYECPVFSMWLDKHKTNNIAAKKKKHKHKYK
jgi:hypothetical protein